MGDSSSDHDNTYRRRAMRMVQRWAGTREGRAATPAPEGDILTRADGPAAPEILAGHPHPS